MSTWILAAVLRFAQDQSFHRLLHRSRVSRATMPRPSKTTHDITSLCCLPKVVVITVYVHLRDPDFDATNSGLNQGRLSASASIGFLQKG